MLQAGLYHEVIRTLGTDEWRVEAENSVRLGMVFVTVFKGPGAEARAREYADWKNSPFRPQR